MEQFHNVSLTRDDKRCGFFVTGDGFDFFAYYTGDFEGAGESFIECDHVERSTEPGRRFHMTIKLGRSGQVTDDVLDTAIKKWLLEWWEL